MIKVIYGPKGLGKTKILIDTANKLAGETKGGVVFIDDSTQLMYDLRHEVRFVNVADFPFLGQDGFFGFLCGIISQNYDVDGICIDGLNYITKQRADELESFFTKLKTVYANTKIDFYITINGQSNDLPEFLKQYI
jgi:DNA replication protein DnaC